jgi:hypothetical protein
MMTADMISGELGWNTSIIDDRTLREVRGKAPKAEKHHLADEYGLIRPGGKSSTADLDTLVSSMEARETLPTSGVSSAREPTGSGKKASSMAGTYRVKPAHKPQTTMDQEINRIIMKYGVPDPQHGLVDVKKRSSRSKRII